MKRFYLVAISLFLFGGLCGSDAYAQTPAAATIKMIQFHSEHRCKTCLKIEEMTKAVLKQYPDIPFSLVNVDDKKNKALAEKFQATGTALFLFNAKTGAKKDLTDFAFMKAFQEEKFKAELKKYIQSFRQGK